MLSIKAVRDIYFTSSFCNGLEFASINTNAASNAFFIVNNEWLFLAFAGNGINRAGLNAQAAFPAFFHVDFERLQRLATVSRAFFIENMGVIFIAEEA